jgi:hypothetical protein
MFSDVCVCVMHIQPGCYPTIPSLISSAALSLSSASADNGFSDTVRDGWQQDAITRSQQSRRLCELPPVGLTRPAPSAGMRPGNTLAAHQLLPQTLKHRCSQRLREDIGLLLRGGNPLQLDCSLLHSLRDEVILDIHMLRPF